jgi:hypothetical protein
VTHSRQTLFWLGFSLLSPLYFGLISLHHAVSNPYIVQDDARQHVVWLQQLVDPELFTHDLIASYFRSVAPSGYQVLYELIAQVGIAPIALAKFLPIGLGLIATIYCFHLSLFILPLPFTAWLSTLLFNQQLWLNDDLVSATPRAFVYPLFTAFLYYLLRSSLFPCLVTILLQGLFFPQLVLLQLAILTVRLAEWRDQSLYWTQTRQRYGLWVSGVAVAAFVLLPFALRLSEFGPVVTAAQMRTMPEYQAGGRNEYFGVTLFQWLFDSSSGLEIPLFPSIVWLGFALPSLRRYWRRSPASVLQLLTPRIWELEQVMLAAFGMFGLASLLLLKLHFPGRYTYHTWRIVLPIATAIVLTALLQWGWRWLQHQRQQGSLHQRGLVAIVCLLLAAITLVPAWPPLFLKFQGWHQGTAPELYAYLLEQPKDSLIASLTSEADNLPAFAQRSTLVAREFALPHHPQYYEQIKQRIIDVVHLQSSPNLLQVQNLIQTYGIDFVLIEAQSFAPNYFQEKDWLIRSSAQSIVQETIAQLEQGSIPALMNTIDRCSVLSTQGLVLLDAKCIARF